MNKLTMLIRLDIQAVRPYFSRTNFIIYAVIGLLVGFFSGMNPIIPIAAIMGFASGYVSYAFNICERFGINMLYATFSVTRRDVVCGRYIFSFTLNAISAIVSFVIVSTVFIVLRLATGYEWDSSLPLLVAMLALINFVQYSIISAVQMPIYYRGGYAKASRFTALSYVTYLTTLAIIMYAGNNGWSWLIGNPFMICSIAFSACLVISLISFFTSCKLYEKRDL